jgi:arabinogalactan endo-1,4-beta-galactosidase
LFISRETYDAIIKKQLICQNKKKKPKEWRLNKFLSRGWSDYTKSDDKIITIFDQAIERAMAQKSAEIRKEYEWPTTSMGAELDEKAWKELFEKDKEKWKMKKESALPDYWIDSLLQE